jgi:beta-lactamase regulating signal transducer with metallopeptidase domain
MTSWLLGTLLATSLLVAIVLLIREPVRRRFGSRVAYGLWLIPAMRLLMPTLTQTVERQVPASVPVQPLIRPVVDEPLLLTSVTPAGSSLFEQIGGWPTILLTIWLGVAAGLFISRMSAFFRDRREILSNGDEVGRLGSIRLIKSREVSSPVAFGILDRVIAVPADFERLYDERERILALDHELAHHRSGDLVANVIAFVLLCLQWFNPLAWVAHSAFRFDQEAACDARVLDKAVARDRVEYGRAIAKAASGRALLFASALDRKHTLHRRLKSMLNPTTAGKRTSGKLLIMATVAVALPLTATRAVEYIDIQAPPAPATPATPPSSGTPVAPLAPATPAMLAVQPGTPAPDAPLAPTAPLAPSAPLAPIAPMAVPAPPAPLAPLPPMNHHGMNMSVNGEMVTINGRTKHWKELTPAEKQYVRGELARAREKLRNTKIDRAEIEREVREAMAEVQADHKDMARDLAEAKVEIANALREIDANAADLRRAGQNPEAIKAQVRASLVQVQAIDVEKIRREALASVDPAKIAASVASAEASVARAQAEIDRLQAKLDDTDD